LPPGQFQIDTMEGLINQLQKTLDEDEAAEKSLLLMRSAGRVVEEAFTPEDEQDSYVVDCGQRLERALRQTPNVFVLQCITSFLTTGNVSYQDLPLKIAALRFGLCPTLMREIYEENSKNSSWPITFTGCFLQVLEGFESYVLKLLDTPTGSTTSNPYLDRVHALRHEIIDIQAAPRGTGV
jgi:hypothetical protein